MDLKLTQGEHNDPLWLKLVAHYEKRLATLRAQNDNAPTEETTARLRGRIAEVKDFLKLGISE